MSNYLENLPLELQYYIGDIIKSDRKFQEWNKKKTEVGRMLTEKFIRTGFEFFNEKDEYIYDNIEEEYNSVSCSGGSSNFIRFHRNHVIFLYTPDKLVINIDKDDIFIICRQNKNGTSMVM